VCVGDNKSWAKAAAAQSNKTISHSLGLSAQEKMRERKRAASYPNTFTAQQT